MNGLPMTYVEKESIKNQVLKNLETSAVETAKVVVRCNGIPQTTWFYSKDQVLLAIKDAIDTTEKYVRERR